MKTKCRTDFRSIENLSEPQNPIRRHKERVIAIDASMGQFGNVIDLSNGVACGFANPLNMPTGEKQISRVDVSVVDEPLRLLGTAAGVVRVHESALMVHELIQVATGSRKRLPKIIGRHLHDFAADRVADADDFPQREDQSLATIKTKQHSGRAGDFGLFDQERNVHRYTLWVGQVEVGCAVNRIRVTGESVRRGLPAAALHVQDMIDGNPVEPRAELAFLLKGAESSDGLDEYFLGHLLGIVRLKDHPHCDVVDPRLMSQN